MGRRSLFSTLTALATAVGLLSLSIAPVMGATTSWGGTIGAPVYYTGGTIYVDVEFASASYVSYLYLYPDYPELSTRQFIAENCRVATACDDEPLIEVPVPSSVAIADELVFGVYVTNTKYTYFMGPGTRNPDGQPHAAVLALTGGGVRVGFEDLYGGGDKDYNDNIFNFTAIAVDQPPVIDSAAMGAVDCNQSGSLNVSFTDEDSEAWSAVIDWDYDGTTFTNDESLTSVTSPFTATHSYAAPGTYTAAVKITDDTALTSAIATTTNVTVKQTYGIDFLPPFDDSTPSGLIVNKMKNGRVVPVKVVIQDGCTLAPVTDPTASVTIKLPQTVGTGGVSDPVEIYADAGQSSADTNLFRWSTDGFWIYNLDSKGLGLTVGNTYRVDVYVGAVKATVDNWAVVQPVK